jgi:hypothetical protein
MSASEASTDEEEMPTLFQGTNNYADAGHKDMVYRGDESFRTANTVTIQIHSLEVREKGKGPLIAKNVPTVAVWIPEAMAKDWLVQQRS